MPIYRRNGVCWIRFQFNGKKVDRSAKTDNMAVAEKLERKLRDEAHEGWSGVDHPARQKIVLREVLDEYTEQYKTLHKTGTAVCVYGGKHLKKHLGERLILSLDTDAIKRYQTIRLQEGAARATIDGEVSLLCRAMGMRGETLRSTLRRRKAFKLNTNPELIGKAFTVREQDRLLAAAAESPTPLINFALQLALNGGLRDKEIRSLKWSQIDFRKLSLRVEKSKNRSSTRDVPLNGVLAPAFEKHRQWFIDTFKELRPSWYVFPSGRPGNRNAAKPVGGFDGPWDAVRKAAGVEGRWHDTRHTVCSMLGERGASEQTIIGVMGHVSPAMLKRYCHVGMEAKREALEDMIVWRNERRELEIAEEKRLADLLAVHGDEKPATIN
jgi:integrase